MAGRHLALVGPTASGKSELALALARANPDVELVSVDSMQVYRGMDIGTAKPGLEDRAEVIHHMIDIADPAERFTVTRFRAAALVSLAEIEARDHVAVVVGGTGLYLQALIGDLDPPGEWPAVRRRLEAEADTRVLFARLAHLDPRAAEHIEADNRRRIVRALEVCEGSGQPFSARGPGVGAYLPTERFILAGIWLPRPAVASRIERRVRAMMAAGLLDEVRSLAGRPGGLGPTARQALGYKELLAYIEQGADLDTMVAAVVSRTRAFSVRQRRWFRRDPRIRWFGTGANPVALVPPLLRELQRCHL